MWRALAPYTSMLSSVDVSPLQIPLALQWRYPCCVLTNTTPFVSMKSNTYRSTQLSIAMHIWKHLSRYVYIPYTMKKHLFVTWSCNHQYLFRTNYYSIDAQWRYPCCVLTNTTPFVSMKSNTYRSTQLSIAMHSGGIPVVYLPTQLYVCQHEV